MASSVDLLVVQQLSTPLLNILSDPFCLYLGLDHFNFDVSLHRGVTYILTDPFSAASWPGSL